MNDAKYIGLDVHQATISAAVLDSAGKLVMEAILETKAETILQFLRGHTSLFCSAESPNRFPCFINTTFENSFIPDGVASTA